MKSKIIQENQCFIGRIPEKKFLEDLMKNQKSALILVTHGRRRVGKTELLEQAFRTRNLVKFEGIEGQNAHFQREHVLMELSKYAENPILSKVHTSRWLEIFEMIYPYIQEGEWTLYFEELQWLADYQSDFIADLKYAWDNFLKNNPKLILILCGSSPSFMIEKVLKSKALYNRSQYELALKPFSLQETQAFLARRSPAEVMDAYLMVGGMPEYLKRANQDSSVLLSIAKESFVPSGFFVHEYERIFTSSLASNPNYQKIVEFLSLKRFATRLDIQKALQLESGGTLSTLLFDLEESGLIYSYVPFDANDSSKLTRYAIADTYLQFYYKFIRPQQKAIAAGDFNENPLSALEMAALDQWKGFAFERFCRAHAKLIAKLLGFDAVKYRHGTYFNRALSTENPGFQIDLLFERADKVYTVCEIKYSKAPISSQVIEEFERKTERLQQSLKKKLSLQRVLISASGADSALINAHYFDRILELRDFF